MSYWDCMRCGRGIELHTSAGCPDPEPDDSGSER